MFIGQCLGTGLPLTSPQSIDYCRPCVAGTLPERGTQLALLRIHLTPCPKYGCLVKGNDPVHYNVPITPVAFKSATYQTSFQHRVSQN